MSINSAKMLMAFLVLGFVVIVGCSDDSNSGVGVSDAVQSESSVAYADSFGEEDIINSQVSSENSSGSYEEINEVIDEVLAEENSNSNSSVEVGCVVSDNTDDEYNDISGVEIHYISGEVKFNIRDGLENEGILRWDKAISAEFRPLTLIDNIPNIFVYPFTSGYSLNLKNEFGEVVYKTPIRVHGINYTWNIYEHDIQWPSQTLPFDTWIVDPPEYTSYAIYNNDIELASLELSKHFPEVEVMEPKACRIIDGSEFEVSWAGSDIDNDSLVYSVEYSYFDQQSGYWAVNHIAENVLDMNLSIKRSEIYNPTSSRSKIRVIVSDGTRSSYAESEVFAVSTAPSVAIDNYDDGETYEMTEFFLSAWATGFAYRTFDNPDVSVDLNFRWHSDITGFLGNGEQIQATLPSGDHTITVTVSDQYGNSASDTIEFKVRNELIWP